MTIIDWNDKESMKAAAGIIKYTSNPLLPVPEVCLFSKTGELKDLLFRNFPKLNAEEKSLKSCVFENCGYLSFENCELTVCTFFSNDTVDFTDSNVRGANFQHICSCHGEPIILEDAVLSGCFFADISLANKSYLCVGYGKSLVELCTFHKIRTDRDDKELFHYAAAKGKTFRSKKEDIFFDKETCSGLEEITLSEKSCEGKSVRLAMQVCSPCLFPNSPKNIQSSCLLKRKQLRIGGNHK